ncbi:leucine-rich repeat receptor-like kinase protein THICK TASSEL DWARF1 [Ananas comosus]|uniref:Leucine-rich repeat receptor-like kinase protein THICK TASSEL DWARF1 n=1 Tax=Ananas comosus TaxID=4615 RepID=A0A6P5FU38_ANACO|nr:leucine-rich repeat receptor-like kinase protein THICK TASSEL DWARF1 [Ananas comosus]
MMAPSSSAPLLFLLLRILLILHLCLLSQQQQQQQQQQADEASSLHPVDAAALLDIRRSLRDLAGSDFFSTWDFSASSGPCASFAGVVCSPDDDSPPFLRVVVLTLGSGLADSPGLTGALPPSLGDLAGLRLLSLSGNLISGPVPPSLAGLPDLHTLDLGDNRLGGPIPAPLLLPSSPSLKVLILAGNGDLSGEIPPEFSASQLLHLDLSRNRLSGGIPQLPSTLRYLSLSANSMSGPLDAAFSGAAAPLLPDLSYLDLSSNAFAGPVPPALFALPSLSSLFLQRNNLSGQLDVPPPPQGAPPPPWAVVDLSHNALSGEVPGALAGAGSLYVNNNRLSGAVPEDVARSVFAGRMTTFYAQHNFLTAFPAPPLPVPDSVALCLSYNCMPLPTPATAAGCPASAGPLPSRPPYQCRTTAAGGDA